MKQLSLSDGRNCPDGLKDGAGHFAINADEGDGIGPTLCFSPAKRERGDIDSEFAQGGPDLPDNSGLVSVSQIKNGAFELRLQRNSFNLQHARRTVMQNGAFRGKA